MHILLWGPKQLPISWFHIPYIVVVYGTSKGPQNDIGNYVGPCGTWRVRGTEQKG